MTEIRAPGDEVRAFIEGMFQMQFGLAHPTIPVKFENAPFNQPKASIFAAFTVLSGSSHQASIGTQRKVERTVGVVQVDVLVPEKQGAAQAKKVCEQGCRIFADTTHQVPPDISLRFVRGFKLNSMPVNGGFHRVSGDVFFEYDVLTEVIG